MEPDYCKWLRENKPEWHAEMIAEQNWAAEWRDKLIKMLLSACELALAACPFPVGAQKARRALEEAITAAPYTPRGGGKRR